MFDYFCTNMWINLVPVDVFIRPFFVEIMYIKEQGIADCLKWCTVHLAKYTADSIK